MTTQKEIRQMFWHSFPEFKNEYRVNKKQNDYPADIRVAFVDFIDHLFKNGQISEKLTNKITL